MTDAAAIARRLTRAQKRALLWLPDRIDTARDCTGRRAASVRSMAPLSSGHGRGLTWPVSAYSGDWYRLTETGLAVRAELERMEAGDA